jgi:triose/dihydroxyacetone kinase / FAD-AMP lyase (cyclizing)
MNTTSKMLLNQPENCVTEAIDGYLLSRSDLVRLQGYKVVIRSELPRGKVALLSGGGAGHEPAHIGLVGKGMLSAAVSGDVFASPPTEAISQTLRVLCESECTGCLLIVKNYTGDKLAFSAAAEVSRNSGFPCEMVLVADDVAVDGGPVTGCRGLAGVVFVHKIAGALSDLGEQLDIVVEAARIISSSVSTVGASISTCNVPGVITSNRLIGEKTEVGLGIHGEPGVLLIEKTLTAIELADHLVLAIRNRIANGAHIAVLINGLGGLSGVETGVISLAIVTRIHKEGFVIDRLFIAPLVTSFDAKGVSLSVLPVNISLGPRSRLTLIEALDAATSVPHWPLASKGVDDLGVKVNLRIPTILRFDSELDESSIKLYVDSDIVCHAFEAIERSMFESAATLDALDALAGDGDTGDTMKRVSNAALIGVKEASKHSQRISVTLLFEEASKSIGRAAGGTSGILYSLMLNIAAHTLRNNNNSNGNVIDRVLNAAETALEAVQRVGGAMLGDRTFLDALVPALRSARLANEQCLNVKEIVLAAAEGAASGAESTSLMIPKVGRATYVNSDIVIGNKDAGAVAASIWLRALANSLPV